MCTESLAGVHPRVADAIQYALRSPGKRVRPLLLLAAYRAAGGTGDATRLSCAPELIHAYSLVHDDLPCMDDDDMRRGRATVHRVFGSRTAILAGVLMIPLAVEVVRASTSSMHLPESRARAIARALLRAAGSGGMIGGQLNDLLGEGLSLDLGELERIHAAKTGELIAACVAMGALAADAGPEDVRAFESYGRRLGLAFQIMDDVLDVTATTSQLGKTSGRDQALGKSTYPALLGVDGARRRAQSLVEEGLATLRERGLLTTKLAEVANFMVSRTS